MIYLFFLLFSVALYAAYDKYKFSSSASILFLFPVIYFWILIIGGQDNVGTDYNYYIDIFNSKDYKLLFYYNKGELLFYYLVQFCHVLGISGQGIFYVFAAINVILYLVIIKKIEVKYNCFFFILFITVSTMFHTQMNGIRQCTAVYIITIALLELYSGRKKQFLLYVIIAAGFHSSALFILIFLLLYKIEIPTRYYRAFILFSSILAFISFDEILRLIILKIPQFSHYAYSDYFANHVSLLNKITKLTTFPFYYFSIVLLKGNFFTSKHDSNLYKLGIYSYLLKTISIVSPVSYRFGHYFFILSLLPLYFYIIYLYRNKSIYLFVFAIAYLVSIYLIKILLFPSGEYLYNSTIF